MKNFVLNLAPTGVVPNKSMTPYVPLSDKEVIADIADCVPLGVTYVHIHARDAQGLPSGCPEIYSRYIAGLRDVAPDLAICVSCTGRLDPSFEARARVLNLPADLRPDMASLTLSSLNFSRSASINDPDTIVRLVERMREQGIVPELEIFDVGMLNYALYLIDRGHLAPPYYFNIILGNLASAQADALHFAAMIRDLPQEALWSVGGIGAVQLKANMLSLLHGGGVRTGLEDNIWYDQDRKVLAKNIDVVKRIVEMAAFLDLKPTPPAVFKQWLKKTDGVK